MRFVRIASFRILVLGVALAGIATAPASAGSNFAQTKLEAFVTAVMVVDELVLKWTPARKDQALMSQLRQIYLTRLKTP